MSEIVFCAADYATLLDEAARLGFVETQDDGSSKIQVSGAINGQDGWFLNIVGEIPDAPGYWGRLRINGILERSVQFSPKITQYVWSENLNNWSSDGKEPAPAFVENVGKIA